MVEDELLDLVLEKKELSGINRSFAKEQLHAWLEENPHVKKEYKKDPERFTRKKPFQKLRREVRKQLREVYGVFFTSNYTNKREKYVKQLTQTNDEATRQEVLKLHRSTNERLHEYPFLYQQLFEHLQTPKSVLDLGCGYNPFSYEYLPCKPTYHCADIACADLELIQQYFDKQSIPASTHCIDLTDVQAVKNLPASDVAFAFKVFDSLETLQRDITAQLLEAIPAKTLIVSFPTKSIGQKKSIGPRKWFEELITDKSVTRVTLENEQFFIITT